MDYPLIVFLAAQTNLIKSQPVQRRYARIFFSSSNLQNWSNNDFVHICEEKCYALK